MGLENGFGYERADTIVEARRALYVAFQATVKRDVIPTLEKSLRSPCLYELNVRPSEHLARNETLYLFLSALANDAYTGQNALLVGYEVIESGQAGLAVIRRDQFELMAGALPRSLGAKDVMFYEIEAYLEYYRQVYPGLYN